MKKLITLSVITLLIFSSCQKDQPDPEVRIIEFSISELPDVTFKFDATSDPVRITNTVLLPSNTLVKSLTPIFKFDNEGSLLHLDSELTSGITFLDFSEAVFLKTVGSDGEIDNYYQIEILVESQSAPLINDLKFTLNPYELTPLAGLLEFKTDRPCTVEVKIIGQDNNDLVKVFPDSASSFSLPILGLYPDYTNHVVISVTDQEGLKNQEGLFIKTDELPELYPAPLVIAAQKEAMEPGMILVYLKRYNDGLANGTKALASMIDSYGKVRWLFLGDYNAVFKRLNNGNWLIARPDKAFEMDMLGHPTGNDWKIPNVHHDIVEMPDGNFLALSQNDDSVEDVILEIGRESGYVEKEWDLKEILDPDRPKGPYHPDPADWMHLNGLDYDPVDDAIIASGRNQSAIVKLDRQTGNIIWILGNHEQWPEEFQKYLLTPVGDVFEWPWGQHAPMLHPNDHSRLICFDNGNERSYSNPLPALNSYSRGVEYQINESEMEIRQLWQYGKGRGRELFCPYIGDANYLLKTNNRLICFGGITRDINGAPSDIFDSETGKMISVKNYTHIIEVDHSGNVVFEVMFADDTPTYAGYRSYRAQKLSLYPE